MSFYDEPEDVEKYIEMCRGYDGSHLYQLLSRFLEDGKTLLELGSGPGFDIPFLAEHFRVTGSDTSNEFLKRCKEKYPEIEFRNVDARSVDIRDRYDCIYSNKVLHHLTEEELLVSLARQTMALSAGGLVAHSFWMGEENQEMEGLLFTYYCKDRLVDIRSESFDVLSTTGYQEIEPSDSLFVIAQLK